MSDNRWKIIAAFAAIYIIWGSTYLGIAIAIETMPPYLMAAARFLIGGTLMMGWAFLRGARKIELVHWRTALIIGGLLLLGGNGTVTWAEQRLPSGLTALLVATVPLWVAVMNWLRPGGVRPGGIVIVGLALGLAGIAALVGPANILGQGEGIDLIGVGALMIATLAWAAGSLYSRSQHARLPEDAILSTGMEMLAGGVLLSLMGIITGEPARLDLAGISMRSLIAFLYLVVFGSIVAFTAYIWLLRNVPPARAATYAYVNPVVAVLLGWLINGEELTRNMLIATPLIVVAVVLITSYRPRAKATAQTDDETEFEAQASAATQTKPVAAGE